MKDVNIKDKYKITKYDVLGIIMYFLIWVVRNLDGSYNSFDMYFFKNRLEQIHTCIAHGVAPVFYYNDFHGVGYGSSFFYGQLTILPFGVFDTDVGFKLLTLFIPVIFYLSIRYFVGKFTDRNIGFITFLITTSEFPLGMVGMSLIYANMYGIAFALLFLGSAVGFFRDKDSMILPSLMFFLLLNTHLITTVIAFICCVMICIYYFDKKCIRQYFKFLGLNIALNLYQICNMLYHSDVVNNTKQINTYLLNRGGISYLSVRNTYVGGFIFRVLTNITDYGYTLVTIPIGVFMIYLLIRNKHKLIQPKKKLIYLILSFVAIIISGETIWCAIMSVVKIPIQFSIRFVFFAELVIFILTFREICGIIQIRVISIIQIISCLAVLVMVILNGVFADTGANASDWQVANGEYLDKSFEWNLDSFNYNREHVIDTKTGKEYPYSVDNQYLIVDLSDNTSSDTVIQVPKLYYKGYVARTDVNIFSPSYTVSMGKSQFLNVDVGSYSGRLIIYYQHPIFLQVLWAFTFLLVSFLLLYKLEEEKI